MPIFTRRLGLGTAEAGFRPLIVHTAGADVTTIVRDIIIVNENTASQIVQLYIASRDGNATIVHFPAMPFADPFHLDLRQELEVDDQLVLVTQLGVVNIVVTGYIFSGTV